MFSDKGTNFVGPDKHLECCLLKLYRITSKSSMLFLLFLLAGTSTPAAPHFEELLREAAIKSVTRHLRWIFGGQVLTFLEYSTLLL